MLWLCLCFYVWCKEIVMALPLWHKLMILVVKQTDFYWMKLSLCHYFECVPSTVSWEKHNSVRMIALCCSWFIMMMFMLLDLLDWDAWCLWSRWRLEIVIDVWMSVKTQKYENKNAQVWSEKILLSEPFTNTVKC